jgi:hypothetical protein
MKYTTKQIKDALKDSDKVVTAITLDSRIRIHIYKYRAATDEGLSCHTDEWRKIIPASVRIE